jgi:hypothetical protein
MLQASLFSVWQRQQSFLLVCFFIYLHLFTSLTSWNLWCTQWTSHHRKGNGTESGCYKSTPLKREFESGKLPNAMLSKPTF